MNFKWNVTLFLKCFFASMACDETWQNLVTATFYVLFDHIVSAVYRIESIG